jgi:trimeric autotransporter adhesin
MIGYFPSMNKGIFAWGLAIAMAFFFSGCGDNDASDSVVGIGLTPSSITVPIGGTRSFSVIAAQSDGAITDVTPRTTFVVANSMIASVTNGTVIGVKAGMTTVTATFGDFSAQAQVTVTDDAVTLTSVAITPATLSLPRGISQQMVATGTFSNGTTSEVTEAANWSSSDAAIAGVVTTGTGAGNLTGVAVGEAVITATIDGKSATAQVTVSAATVTSIAVTPDTASIARGVSLPLVATATFSDATTQDVTGQATWTSNNDAVVRILEPGLVKGETEGTATISAALSGQTGTSTVTVTAAILQSIQVTPSSPSVADGQSQQFTATGLFSDNTNQDLTTQVLWSSATTSVASIISNTGLATAEGPGTSVISASLNGITGSTVMTVTNAVLVSLSVEPLNPSVAKGRSQAFIATGTFSDTSVSDVTKDVLWTSSNESVATISNANPSQGVASTTNVGETTVTAALNGLSSSTTLTVTSATLVSIAVTPVPTAILPSGLTLQFTATGTFSDGSTSNITDQVTWSTSAANRVSISNVDGSRGLAKALSNSGTHTIRAQLGAILGTSLLRLTAASVASIAVTPSNTTAAKGSIQQFVAIATFTDGSTAEITGQCTWTTASSAVAVVSNAVGSKGLATAAGVGTTSIRAARGAISGSTNFTVTAATLVSIQVTPTTPSVAKGLTLPFTATGTFTDGSTQDITQSVTWTTSAAGVAGISNVAGNEGVATTVSAGTTTIVATVATLSGSTVLTVTGAVLTRIEINPTTPSIGVGLTQQFTATGVYSDNTVEDLTTQVAWNSATLAIATISNADGSRGLASAVAIGTTTISAQFGALTGSTELEVSAAVLASIEVAPSQQTIPAGTALPYSAVGTFSDGSTQDLTTQVTWSTANPAIATASNAQSEQGLVRGLAVGSTQVRATLGAITGSTSVTIGNATLVSIGVTPAGASLAAGLNLQYIATGTFSNGTTQDLTTTVGWASSSINVATVSSAAGTEGLAKGLSAGTTTITATLGLISGSTTLDVTSATLVAIQVTPANTVLNLGLSAQMTATGVFSDNSVQNLTSQVTWSSANQALVLVSNAPATKGLAAALATGSTSITATFGAVSGVTPIRVTRAQLLSIAVSPANSTMAKGTSRQFTATGTYSDGQVQDITSSVTWSSLTPAVLTISNVANSKGVGTAVATGTVTVRARLVATIGNATVNVTSATLTSIAVSPAALTLSSGVNQPYTATGTFSDGSTQDLTDAVTWATSNAPVATVSNAPGSKGLASTNAAGTATIVAALGAINGSTTLTVSAAQLVSIAVSPSVTSTPVGFTLTFSALGTFSDSSEQDITDQVTWLSADPAASNPDGNNLFFCVSAAGEISITASLGAVTGTALLNCFEENL